MEANAKFILLVDDSIDHQSLVTQLFEGEGCKIKCVSNGQEALDLLRASTVLPAVILLDLMMPVMDGYIFRQEQERDTKLASIPVVVMTADGHIEAKKIQLGTVDFVKKPVDIEELLNKVLPYCS